MTDELVTTAAIEGEEALETHRENPREMNPWLKRHIEIWQHYSFNPYDKKTLSIFKRKVKKELNHYTDISLEFIKDFAKFVKQFNKETIK